MKKRFTVYILLTVLLLGACIIPPLAERIAAENSMKGFVCAVEIESVADAFDSDEETVRILKEYKKSGISAAAWYDISPRHSKFLRLAKEAGLDIALKVKLGKERSKGYMNRLRDTIKNNHVKYIIMREAIGATDYKVPLKDIIEENHLTLVISENTTQLSNVMPAGYDDYLQEAEGRVMRSYETMKEPICTISDPENASAETEFIYYHMANSAMDRNIKFFIVNQLDDGFGDEYNCAERTCGSVKKFSDTMESMGYHNGYKPDLSDYMIHRTLPYAAAAMLAVLMVAVIGILILGIRSRIWDYILLGLGIFAFGITFCLPKFLLDLYPTLYAPVAACFSFSICLWISDKTKKFNTFLHGVLVFASAFVLLILCASALCALFVGADYHLNNFVFRGVKLSLLIPIGFAAVATPVYMVGGIRNVHPKQLLAQIPVYAKKIKPIHIVLLLVVLAAGGLYILRSGNAKITIQENLIRNKIAVLTGARPRTKEFLICWPCLALFVYYTKNYYGSIIRWVFAVGSSVLFASVINTFCHVFTNVTVSFMRTVYGLLFAIPVIALALIANKIILVLIEKIRHKITAPADIGMEG